MFSPTLPTVEGPAFARGSWSIAGAPTDTYLTLPGWSKGMVWVNGFNIGRYWNPRGPQEALYVPSSLLVSGANTVTVLELDVSPAASVAFTAVPDFSGPVCNVSAAAPADGFVVAMAPCTPLRHAQLWVASASTTASATTFRVHPVDTNGAVDSTLCVSAGPRTDPSTGQPGLQLSQCGAAGGFDLFSLDAASSALLVAGGAPAGSCVDITSHSTAMCAGVEMYSCNGGDNQQWTTVPTVGGGSSPIVSKQDGHCMSVVETA